MQKISILYLIDQMRNIGGAEINLLNTIMHLNKERFNYLLYTFQLDFPMKGLLEKNKIMCVQIPYPTSFQGLLRFLALSRKIRAQRIKILHTYFEGSDIYGIFLAKLTGIPVIISSKRDMGISKSKKILTAYRFINPFVDKMISVSEAVKQHVNTEEKVNLNRIVTIYNGVDFDKYFISNHKNSLNLPFNVKKIVPVVGVLANIRPIKGIEYFIRAAAKVQKLIPETHFIVIGACIPDQASTSYFEHLKSLVKELKLENNLFFLGERIDIPEILSLMDVSVLPSLSEGFSNSILESMAAGKPLVVTNVGGNAEAVLHGKTGFVVPPRNVGKLAEAITAILMDKELAKRMGNAGRERIKEVFSIQTMVDKIENLYITTLNSKRKYLTYSESSKTTVYS
jgi:glycosyltransferase involved in cell wall biosynthesis